VDLAVASKKKDIDTWNQVSSEDRTSYRKNQKGKASVGSTPVRGEGGRHTSGKKNVPAKIVRGMRAIEEGGTSFGGKTYMGKSTIMGNSGLGDARKKKKKGQKTVRDRDSGKRKKVKKAVEK